MEFSWGTSLHDGDVEEFLTIKTPQWRCGGVLEEQASLMEDMRNYFRKWREWRNRDLGNKSSTFVKVIEKDEARDNQSTNQPINQSTNQSINQSIESMSSTNPSFQQASSFSISFQQFEQAFSNFNNF